MKGGSGCHLGSYDAEMAVPLIIVFFPVYGRRGEFRLKLYLTGRCYPPEITHFCIGILAIMIISLLRYERYKNENA